MFRKNFLQHRTESEFRVMNNPDDKLTGKYIRKFVNLRIYEGYESMKFCGIAKRTMNAKRFEVRGRS